MSENMFRMTAAIILLTGVGIPTYFRRKADRESGEKTRSVDGKAMMTVIKVFGLLLWLSPCVYLLNPAWMAWSKIGLPDAPRWLGVLIGVLSMLGIYWLFSSIGSGITPTSATRRQHTLVTSADPLALFGPPAPPRYLLVPSRVAGTSGDGRKTF